MYQYVYKGPREVTLADVWTKNVDVYVLRNQTFKWFSQNQPHKNRVIKYTIV